MTFYSKTRLKIAAQHIVVIALMVLGVVVAVTAITRWMIITPHIAWPLKKSSSGRYLVDQNNDPFLVNGDSPQSLVGTLSEVDDDIYFANRRTYGINAGWIHLYINGGRMGESIWGDPFSPANDIAHPREEYFAHVDRVLNIAKKHGYVLFFGVAGAASHPPDVFLNEGADKAREYGRYIGNRYKNQGNIIWQFGNDWKTYTNPMHNNVILSMAAGIREGDGGRHPMSLEIYPTPKCSLDSAPWKQYIDVNLAYSYAPIYTTVNRCYNQAAIPVVSIETIYELGTKREINCRHGYCGTPRILRSMQHWAILSGALGGHVCGHEDMWNIDHNDILQRLDTAPQKQLLNIKTLYGSRRWYDLIPDSNHSVVTGGYGECPAGAEWGYDVGKADCTTTARTPDGKLVIAYMERPRAATVDMSKLSGPAKAQWFNSATGVYSAIAGSPLPNRGSKVFTPPSGGEGDWVLIIEATN